MSLLKEIYKLTSAHYIDTAGNCIGICSDRLLFEINYAAVIIKLNASESGYIGIGLHGLNNHCDISLLLDVILKHPVVIKLVNTVTCCNDNIWLM